MENETIETLLGNQRIINGNLKNDLTAKMKAISKIESYEENDVIVKEGEQSNDLFFILTGEIIVEINGRKKAVRKYGEQVGEMAVLNPGAPRSATLRAGKNVMIARVSEKDFSELAEKFPQLWKNIGQVVAARLLERNFLERERNNLPRVFIISSSESGEVMEAIEQSLKDSCGFNEHLEVVTWKESNIFQPSIHPIEALENEAKKSDFAIIVLGQDDLITSRKKKEYATRDNVIFEMGLFMGAIGRDRIFIVEPQPEESSKRQIKIPTDLAGLIRLRFKSSDMKESISKISTEIRKIILDKKQI